MLSKAKLKYIRSLREKKFRIEHGTFIAESNKLVKDLIPFLKCQLLIATSDFLSDIDISTIEEVIEVTPAQLIQASSLQNPQQVLAVFYQPRTTYQDININNELVLALDGIQDPGNLGTIVRLADWYGIKHVFCSHDTVDIYNTKVIQATMGAIARVRVYYTDLERFFTEHKGLPVYGTFLDGEDIYTQEITAHGVIVMGNEGNGIRPEIEKWINKRLYIPNYLKGQATSESLNVAIATAIVCAEFRRRFS